MSHKEGPRCHEIDSNRARRAGVTNREIAPSLRAVLEQERADDTVFRHLNTALSADGAFVRVPAGVALERPVHLVFLATASDGGESYAVHPTNVILAERRSELRARVERHRHRPQLAPPPGLKADRR